MRWWAYGLAWATLAAASLINGTLEGLVVPTRVPLTEVPFVLAGWSGRAEPVSPTLMARAAPDEVLHRRYADRRGREIIVYVAYYARDAGRGHVLAQCPSECVVVELATEAFEVGGRLAVVNRADVVLDGVPMVVLYWFQQGSRILADPYRGKMEQLRRALLERRTNGTVIRISAPVVTAAYEARERSIAFARTLLPALEGFLPQE